MNARDQASGSWDAIVIGAGLGGLSSTAFLAAAGKRTLLLERYTALGGSSHVFRRQGRWEFDCGVHYVGHCGRGDAIDLLMRALGLNDRIEWLPLDSQAIDRIIGPGVDIAVPHGWDGYLANILDQFPEERKAITRWHSGLRRLGASVDRFRTQAGTAGWAGTARRAGLSTSYGLMPYAGYMAACGLSSKLMLTLSVQAGALGALPVDIPTVVMAALLQDFVGTGAYYPKGGGQMLSAGFAEVVRANGGSIRTGAEVDRILIEGGKVAGVRLADGELIRAPHVVSDADVIKTFRDLVGTENLPRRLRAQIGMWKMSRPVINGFFGVEYDISQSENSNFFAIPSWEIARSTPVLLSATRKFGGGGFSDGGDWARFVAEHQPMFVQSSSRRDPANDHSAPPGHASIEVQTLSTYNPKLWGYRGLGVESGEYRGSDRYSEIKKIIIDGMLERMEQAYPGSSHNVKLAELGTPATQARFVGNTAGAPMGLKQSFTQFGPNRPGPRTAIPGLYIAGTSSAFGPGTVGSMISGLHAASAATGRDLVGEVEAGKVLVTSDTLDPWTEDFDPLKATRALRA